MLNKPWTQEMKDAFEEMRKAELPLDDMDYIKESPRYKTAMAAAAKFHAACDKQSGEQPRTDKGGKR